MTTAPLTDRDSRALTDCVAGGGVAVFPTDTVYGLCCDPQNERAVARLYELKGRPRERAAAVMFFELAAALAAVPEIDATQWAAALALLPGAVTVLLSNPAGRYAAACGGDPHTLGLRVPALGAQIAALAAARGPLLQSSANLTGAADARTLGAVPREIREQADLVLDGGTLAGVPSTVVDLRELGAGDAGGAGSAGDTGHAAGAGRSGRHRVLREGALAAAEVDRLLAGGAP